MVPRMVICSPFASSIYMHSNPPGYRPSVVLVEDDPGISAMLVALLERAGCAVHALRTIAAARKTMAEADWDLVLLDRNLPDGDSLTLCRETRDSRPDGYIIIVTAAVSDSEKLRGFASGADDYITKPFNVEELLARVRAGLRIVSLQKTLRRQSVIDDLTQLRNRRGADEELTKHFAGAIRYQRPLALAVVDIDHFKSINDRFGHPAGDAVLRNVGALLREASRATDVVSRIGGEEFSVLLPETGLFEAVHFGEKIRALAAATPIDGTPITMSVGIASLPHSHFTSSEELVFAADHALYRAKQSGRNRVESEKRTIRFARKTPFAPRRAELSLQA